MTRFWNPRGLFLLPALLVVLPLPSASAQNPLGRKDSKAPVQAPDPLAGEWRGDGLVVQFVARAAHAALEYEGKIQLGEAAFPMLCTRTEAGDLTGSFQVEGERYAFLGRLANGVLTLQSEGASYRLEPVRAANPLARPSSAGQAPPVAPGGATRDAVPSAPPPVLVPYTHPRGFQFQHPEGWQVQAAEEGIMVIAAGVERDSSGQPLEMFVIGGEEAEGVQRPDQTEVLAWFDGQMAEMFPKMKRGGATDALDTLLGAGAILHYAGKTPTDLEGLADVYVTLRDGLGIFMLHLGRKDLVEAHENDARRMFSSFGWSKGQLDPDLVGVWHRNESSSASSLGSDGYFDSVGGSTSIDWEFRADGSVTYTSGTRFYGDVGGASIDDPGGRSSDWVGTWSVKDGTVTMQWNAGGVEQYAYTVFINSENRPAVKLTAPGETKGTFYLRP